jgi:plastocyanin
VGQQTKKRGRGELKHKQKRFGLLAAIMLVSSAPALAHDECDDDPPKPAPMAAKPQPAANVTIRLFQFQPARIEVRPGTTVTWVNEDEILHTVTAEKEENSFAADLDGKGRSFSFTFAQPGSYRYYCDRHEHMRGEVLVVSSTN